jgi:hypothetical protein
MKGGDIAGDKGKGYPDTQIWLPCVPKFLYDCIISQHISKSDLLQCCNIISNCHYLLIKQGSINQSTSHIKDVYNSFLSALTYEQFVFPYHPVHKKLY